MAIRRIPIIAKAERITYFARQNLLEHGWRDALRIIQQIVPELSIDQAAQIFKGEKRFIDDERNRGDILFVDDPDSKEWKSELNEKYGGICKIGCGYYQPYAVVDSFGPNDIDEIDHDVDLNRLETNDFVSTRMLMAFDQHRDSINFPADRGDFEKRAMHYAWDPGNDKAIMCRVSFSEGVFSFPVLFEEVEDLPFWIPELTPQEAVSLLEGDLGHLGFQHEYGSPDLANERSVSRMTCQAKLNFADQSFRLYNNNIPKEKLDDFLVSQKLSTPEHFEQRRREILKQNDDLGYGYRSVDFGGKLGVRNIPNGPLVKWALNRGFAMKDQGPEWKPVSMSGLKMAGDDPVHSDWITAIGLENENFYEEPLKSLQDDLFMQIQHEELGFTAHVLVAGKTSAVGIVKYCNKDTEVDGQTIAIIPNAGIRYDRIAREAAGVIVLEGGAMSHLAVNGLEMGQVILRDPDAKKKYEEGSFLRVDIENGRVLKLADLHLEENDTPSGPKM
ncbi:hypothetical protein [Roseibium sp. RKSG952]|uniref:hypothetical protein n=1 Tax=Roseibium sp. RKSG952 TaxID=2529384 RepID=UPI0012BD19B0|nr:hypothetical protein [Roseibium sp. RKSG952]MTH94938.1 hypothetical protein [Roseibium sp. RKSG952]